MNSVEISCLKSALALGQTREQLMSALEARSAPAADGFRNSMATRAAINSGLGIFCSAETHAALKKRWHGASALA